MLLVYRSLDQDHCVVVFQIGVNTINVVQDHFTNTRHKYVLFKVYFMTN